MHGTVSQALALSLACALACAAPPASAMWMANGVPVCVHDSSQAAPQLVADGAGGVIIACEDRRGGSADVYAQRLDANGSPMWAVGGVLVYSAGNDQEKIRLVSDGAGGAILVWEDYHAGTQPDIFAQRVTAPGALAWARPVSICAASGSQFDPRIVADGAGGAIVTWWDFRSGAGTDIYAQRVNSSGAIQWALNGVAVCTNTSDQGRPDLAMAGSSSVIIAWEDYRNGWMTDIYAQRLSLAGGAGWTANGVPVCTAAARSKSQPRLVSDGTGGAIIVWADWSALTGYDLYAQRVGPTGATMWTASGVPVCVAANDQAPFDLCEDGFGGALLCWQDMRAGSGSTTKEDIYAQRLDPEGKRVWAANGEGVCVLAGQQFHPRLVPDGAGGALVVFWEPAQGGLFEFNIFAQQVYEHGNLRWPGRGITVSAAPEAQAWAEVAPDGNGGAFVAWMDTRTDPYNDIWAQWVDVENIGVGTGTPPAVAVRCRPNPFAGSARLALALSAPSRVTLSVHDASGRLVRALADEWCEAGPREWTWNGEDADGRPAPPGIYFGRFAAEGRRDVVRIVLLR
jgi:hypothetical protein